MALRSCWEAVGFWVAVVRGVVGLAGDFVQDVLGCGDIGVADAEGDDVFAPGPLLGDLAGDLKEEVRGKPVQALG